MFQAVPESESKKVIQSLISGKVSLVGKTDNQTVLLAKVLRGSSADFLKFACEFKSNKILEPTQTVTFSFVCFGKKYLFKAMSTFVKGAVIEITPTTELFVIHRRNSERINIPDDYYAVLKITNHGNRIVRIYTKVKDISAGGCGVVLRSEEPEFKSADIIKGSLHFSSRPPFDIDGEVRHKRIIESSNAKFQQFGILFLPAESIALGKKMRVILMDIYRDLFSENPEQ